MDGCEPNSIITLTTDFGTRDIFVGVMKGIILGINRNAELIDITHDITPQDIQSASFLTDSFYHRFPPGTTHLVVIDPGVGGTRRGIAVQTENYFFVAPDNGVLTEVLSNNDRYKAVSLTNESFFLPNISHTFHGRDIFAPVSAHLSKHTPLSALGPLVSDLIRLVIPIPNFMKHCIRGQIRYIDRFGNLITNISEDDFRKFCHDDPFEIRVNDAVTGRISRSYDDEEAAGSLVAIFNSFNLLELAIYRGNAASEFNLHSGNEIIVALL